jgi:catechol 2,3-dioxygenase-like lactoylglutathione lyase family enzyme
MSSTLHPHQGKSRDFSDVKVIQIAMNTADLAGSLALYSELFGFVNAGATAIWGDTMRIQGLAPDSHAVVWWMVGGAPFYQLEFFSHGRPKQRPQSPDWRSCDHGWVRFGVAVRDFDRVIGGLGRWGIAPLGASGATRRRRLAFRDPYVGAIVEVMESDAGTCPTMIYATNSVAEIGEARRFYEDVLAARIEPLESLHHATDEALWGLENAVRDGFLVRFDQVVLEIVQYMTPRGRARPSDHCIADQGIMNLALGSRDVDSVRALIQRIQDAGHQPTVVFDGNGCVCTYFTDPGCEFEILAVPESGDAATGFAPAIPFSSAFDG